MSTLILAAAVLVARPGGRALRPRVRGADRRQPFLLVLLYLTGTILYVKTMIRERDSESYRAASIIYHAVALAAVVTQGVIPAAVFALLLLRAWLLPGRGLVPQQVGLLEIAASILVLVAAVT
ncbi:hypothetical protein [Paractinoplanes atraurantiacus]|uniref:Uncharacterized protein n=1 Tax=Paractinoplanes atraurantiacus TaxID=1036182 RepID=A0A285J3M4_9ACTN|nr:hypothetical protein [Actinoplanes atraurantiacus]SNY54935.1 hypothetical protein SAMN05421748_115198 [Actinoplanes atraurantiacus]